MSRIEEMLSFLLFCLFLKFDNLNFLRVSDDFGFGEGLEGGLMFFKKD